MFSDYLGSVTDSICSPPPPNIMFSAAPTVISASTLDDLLRRVLEKLLKSKNHVSPSKGPNTELICVLLQLKNPRARLSRTEMKGTLFSCLGELLWYLAKTNDLKFISYYLKDYARFSDDGRTVHGAYGPRLFNMRHHNQVENVIALLKRKRSSRQAVIQLFDARDIAVEYKDVPCTCTLQFLLRSGRLHMLTSMRSNDAYLGLPHDIFAFTMLQEIVARSLKVEVGTYNHAVGSLHLYDRNRESARKYLKEGWQATAAMPPLPSGNPWHSIQKLLKAERAIRRSHKPVLGGLDSYWMDLIRLLQIFWHFKNKESSEIVRLKGKMSVSLYHPHIEEKRTAVDRRATKAN
jgi:thymidylate synthase